MHKSNSMVTDKACSNLKAIEQKLPFIFIILKGFGQIMLQENAATGLLFLIGIFYGSVTMGFAALLSVIVGTLTAQVLRFDKVETTKGIYGFSAALTGVALILYFEPTFLVWIFILTGSVLASVLQHLFSLKRIPVYTFPFVIITWGIIYLLKHLFVTPPSHLLSATANLGYYFLFPFKGYGQVIFQSSAFAGIIFFIAVFINSPLGALYGFVGALLAGVISTWFSIPTDAISLGLFSYNAVLSSIVFAGNKKENAIWVFISTVIAVLIGLAFYKNNLIQLTFPFVAATWISLILKNKIKKLFFV